VRVFICGQQSIFAGSVPLRVRDGVSRTRCGVASILRVVLREVPQTGEAPLILRSMTSTASAGPC
jgi:hypothetical protein